MVGGSGTPVAQGGEARQAQAGREGAAQGRTPIKQLSIKRGQIIGTRLSQRRRIDIRDFRL